MTIKELVRRYIFNEDLEESKRHVLEHLAAGTRREAAALRQVVKATGDKKSEELAEKAEQESERYERMLSGMTELYGRGRNGSS